MSPARDTRPGDVAGVADQDQVNALSSSAEGARCEGRLVVAAAQPDGGIRPWLQVLLAHSQAVLVLGLGWVQNEQRRLHVVDEDRAEVLEQVRESDLDGRAGDPVFPALGYPRWQHAGDGLHGRRQGLPACPVHADPPKLQAALNRNGRAFWTQLEQLPTSF